MKLQDIYPVLGYRNEKSKLSGKDVYGHIEIVSNWAYKLYLIGLTNCI